MEQTRSARAKHPTLPIFAKTAIIESMGTMNISLPDSLKSFVDEQVRQRGFSTSSEYMRELIRKDQDRTTLREMLLAGARSRAVGHFDAGYFEGLRKSVQKKA